MDTAARGGLRGARPSVSSRPVGRLREVSNVGVGRGKPPRAGTGTAHKRLIAVDRREKDFKVIRQGPKSA